MVLFVVLTRALLTFKKMKNYKSQKDAKVASVLRLGIHKWKSALKSSIKLYCLLLFEILK